MNPLLDAALEYERQGFSVVPLHTPTEDGACSCGKADCESQGKHSRVPWKEFQSRRATPDEIRKWWTRWPDANVGIVTGAVSDIVVPVVDGEQGRAAVRGKHLPPTPTVLTGREGGVHYYHRHPGFECRNAAGAWPDGNNYPGLDFRGDGGLVAAPPSLHASGRTYQFADGLALGEVDLAPCPDWLLTMLTAAPSKPVATIQGDTDTIPQGKRKSTLMKLAGAMRRQGASELVMLAALHIANDVQCSPPLPDSEVEDVAASAAKYEPDLGIALADMPTITGLELLERDDEPFGWLAQDLLPEAGVSMLPGDSGCGKTWLALDLALAISSGRQFLNHFETLPGRVLYVDLESGPRRMKARLAQLRRPDDVPELIEFAFFGESLGLEKETNAEQFAAFVEAKAPRLLIIDPLRGAHGADENDSTSARKVVRCLRGLAERTGYAVLVLHHERKPSANTSNRQGQGIRGSSDWKAGMDSVLSVSRKEPDVILVEHSKSRDCPEQPDFRVKLNLDETPGVITYYGDVPTAEKRKGVEVKILDHLAASGAAWRRDLMNMTEEWKVCEKTIKRALDELVASDTIAVVIGPHRAMQYVLKGSALFESGDV